MAKDIIEKGSIFFRAYVLLVFVDLGMRLFGFPKIAKICLKEVNLVEDATAAVDWAWVSKIVQIAERTFLLYIGRQTECLERSLVICYLLRQERIPAQLCLGCTKYPPLSFHAWVECAGRIVNDLDSIKDTHIKVAVK